MYWMIALSALAFDPATPPREALLAAVAVIEHQEQSTKSCRLSFVAESKSISLSKDRTLASQKRGATELQQARRYRSQVEFPKTAAEAGSTMLNAFDGTTYRQYLPEEKAGSTNTKSGASSGYLVYTYGSLDPLSVTLKAGLEKAESRWTNLEGRTVLECILHEESELTRTLFLDQQQGWQPRRIVMDQVAPRGVYPDGRLREIRTINIRECSEQQGVFVPKIVDIEADALYPENKRLRTSEARYELTSLEINGPVDDSEFTIDFPDGTTVSDRDREVSYIVGQPGSEKSRRQPASNRPAMTSSGALWAWWADWRIWSGAALLCAVGIAGVSWRRLGN